MQVEIPQIYWHDNSARIMSIDVYPNSNFFVTASVVSDDDSGIRVSKEFYNNIVAIQPNLSFNFSAGRW